MVFPCDAFIILIFSTAIAVVFSIDLNGTAVKVGRTAYYLNNSFKYTFPDRYTFNAMGFDFGKLPGQSKDFINSVATSPQPLQSLWDHHASKKLLSLGDSTFFKNPRIVFKELLNPCYVYWNGNIVISWRHTPEVMI